MKNELQSLYDSLVKLLACREHLKEAEMLVVQRIGAMILEIDENATKEEPQKIKGDRTVCINP